MSSELFPEWKAEYLARNVLHGLPIRLQHLHTLNGSKDGETCGGCRFLIRNDQHGFFKCQKYGETASTASDWRKRWPACGLWECHS
jgi:hypothetical protein